MTFEAELLDQMAKPALSDKAVIDKLEALKARQTTLETQRTRLETKIEAAKKEYDRLCGEAVAKFQTADATELQAKLLAMRSENERAVLEFEAAINQFEAALSEISQQVG